MRNYEEYLKVLYGNIKGKCSTQCCLAGDECMFVFCSVASLIGKKISELFKITFGNLKDPEAFGICLICVLKRKLCTKKKYF